MTPVIRDSVRTWRRSPVTALAAVCSLALGIGAVTTFYRLADVLLLQHLPVAEPRALVTLETGEPGARFSSHVWRELDQRPELYESAFAWAALPLNAARSGPVSMVQTVVASGRAFETLGLHPALGRLFDARDDQPPGGPDGPAAVISHNFWQRQFGASLDVLGERVTLEGAAFTIVGVLPASFRGFQVGLQYDVIIPLSLEPQVHRDFSLVASGRVAFLRIMMRHRKDETPEALTARIRAEQPRIREASLAGLTERRRDSHLRSPLLVVPAPQGGPGIATYYGRAAAALLGLAALVLLACCGNVASVLLAHGARRRHELSVRLAVGASRWEPARQLATDGLLLSVVGAVIGLALSGGAGRFLLGQLEVPSLDAQLDGPNWRVWALASTAAIVTGVVSAAAAAWRAGSIEAVDALHRRTGISKRRLGIDEVLVAGQVAFAVVVVLGGAVLLGSYLAVVSNPALAELKDVVAVDLRLARSNVPSEVREDTVSRVQRAVSARFGVLTSVALSVPFTGGAYFAEVESARQASPSPRAQQTVIDSITASHFAVLGLRLVAGRRFDDRPESGAPAVAVVNEVFARQFLGGPLNVPQAVTLNVGRAAPLQVEVIGVVQDLPYEALSEPTMPLLYTARAQYTHDLLRAFVVLRSPAAGGPGLETLQTVIDEAAPGLTYELVPLTHAARQPFTRERVLAGTASFFAGVILLIVGLGVFGMTSHHVATKQRELAIRVAVGALPRQIAALIASRAARSYLAGVAMGLLIGWWSLRLLAGFVRVWEPYPFAPVAGTVILIAVVVAAAASWPTRRACRTDAAVVLRAD